MNNNIIIFGSESILAQNFINKYKCSNNNIISISRDHKNKESLCCNLGEIMFPNQIEEIASNIIKKLFFKETIFILFAWYGGPRNKNDQDIYDKNINIISNFSNICKKVNPNKIIFLSSSGSIYPQNLKNYNFDEEDGPSPITTYGKLKLLAERLISFFSEVYKIDCTILRIASAYGYDKRFSDQGVINKWLYNATTNQSLEIYNSINSQINFISFDQISLAIMCSIDNDIIGIFNVGTDKSISLGEIINEIKKITKKEIILKKINNDCRFFNINTQKFYNHTGLKFKLNLHEDIKNIHNSIKLIMR